MRQCATNAGEGTCCSRLPPTFRSTTIVSFICTHGEALLVTNDAARKSYIDLPTDQLRSIYLYTSTYEVVCNVNQVMLWRPASPTHEDTLHRAIAGDTFGRGYTVGVGHAAAEYGTVSTAVCTDVRTETT